MSRKLITEALALASMRHWLKLGFSSYQELCVDVRLGRRADVISGNLKGNIVISETKSSVADYRTDGKWREYLPYCERFYFVFTDKVWSKLEATERSVLRTEGAGVMVLEATGFLKTVLPAKRRKVPAKIKYMLFRRLAWRGGFSKRGKRKVRTHVEPSWVL